jgi:iron complex outermembrane receptor protein
MKIILCTSAFVMAFVSFSQDSLTTVKLEDVMIEGIRASESAPISQTTVDRNKISNFDVGQDASVIIEKLSPSIISFSDAGSGFGNYNQFRLRGIDQTRINITLNGIPLNDMVDQGVFFSNFVDFSSSLESLQIQRGVGLSSNGTASYAGSINYESVNLDNKTPQAGLNFTGGSFGTIKLNTEAFSGRSNNDFSAYARVSRIVSDGYKNHSGSDAQSLFVSAGKFFDKSVLKFTAFAGKTQNDQAYLPVLLSDIKADPKTNYFSENDTDDFEQELLQLQYATSINDDLKWNSSIYYGGARGYFPFFDSFFNSQTLYILSNDHYGISSQLNWYKDKWQLSGGIHAYLFDRKNETATAPNFSTPYYEDRTDKDELSAFAKLEVDFNQLTIFADVQLRNVSMRFTADTLTALTGSREAKRDELFINPRIGATWHLNQTSNLYASFGRTGREPTRTDLLQGDFNSAISNANFMAFVDDEVIKSEYVNDLEVGYRYGSPNLKLAVNGFFMAFEDEISVVGGLAQNSYIALRQNVEKSTRAGVEIDASYMPSANLTVSLLSTFMRTNVEEFDTGVEIVESVEHVFAPKLILSPALKWKPTNNTSIGLDVRYVGESYMELGNVPGYIIPSFFVANGNIQWSIDENISAGIVINNLFDEQYFTDGAPVDFDFDGSPEGPGFRIQPPRNYFFTLNFKF